MLLVLLQWRRRGQIAECVRRRWTAFDVRNFRCAITIEFGIEWWTTAFAFDGRRSDWRRCACAANVGLAQFKTMRLNVMVTAVASADVAAAVWIIADGRVQMLVVVVVCAGTIATGRIVMLLLVMVGLLSRR